MPIPISILQICKPIEYHQSAFSFQIPDKVRYTYAWWYTQQHMDMIFACFRFYNFHVFLFTQFSKYLSDFCLQFPIYNLSPILWRKHDMVFAIPL